MKTHIHDAENLLFLMILVNAQLIAKENGSGKAKM